MVKPPPKYVPASKAEKTDLELTYQDLLTWCGGDLSKVGETLRSRIGAYARNSKAKGLTNLRVIEWELSQALGRVAAENRKRQQKAEAVKRHALKRLRQYMELEADKNVVALLSAFLPLIDDSDKDEKFEFSQLYAALETRGEVPDEDFWFTYARDAATARMNQAYAAHEYGRMNRIGELVAELDAAIEAVNDAIYLGFR